tara:strand:+ start:145 stop:1482 length:1338 start_codon:yes stop_codon:yes gene_type:complete
MLNRISRPLVILVEKYLPDPFIFVLVLTFIVMAGSVGIQGHSWLKTIQFWGQGFWGLLGFSMQMLLILINGFLLANTKIIQFLLTSIASKVASAKQAIVLISIMALLASWINWGFGLVISAFFAKALARYVKVDYKLLVASAYSGFLVWHGGLSGSIPLTIALDNHFLHDSMGAISTSDTIFSSYNMILVATLFLVIPIVNMLMLPSNDESVFVSHKISEELKETQEKEEEQEKERIKETISKRYLENSHILAYGIGLSGLFYIVHYFMDGGGLNLNIINFTFLFLAILLHGTPHRVLHTLDKAAGSGSGIILQFPFYAGIMAIMTQSGLAAWLSQLFIDFSTPDTFIFWSFISAGIINFFVPSGGGQWAVQSPIFIPAAQALGVDVARTAMAISWGDAWTNMVQPFWALPILAIAGLSARDIMGFCLVHLMVSGVIMSACLVWL